MASWVLGETCTLLGAKTAALLGFNTAAAISRQTMLPYPDPWAEFGDYTDRAAQLLSRADRITRTEGFCPRQPAAAPPDQMPARLSVAV